MLHLQVYIITRIRRFDVGYLEKVFLPNKSEIRDIN